MSLDGQEINYTPEKNDYIVNVTCDKDAEAYWDTEIWGLVVKDFEKGIKCSVDFETKYLTNHIKYLANTSDELLVDETEDQNIRYVGANPNNYVLFNNELWRIVGVMNNVQNEQNESETRIKLVRASNIGNYPWDYKADGTYGGDWSTSTLQELLNGAYYNKTTGIYYKSVESTPTPATVDFTEIGLSEEARNQIDIASWNITAIPFEAKTIEEYIKAEKYYLANIGLIGKGDLALATKSGETSRRECLNKEIFYGWKGTDCFTNNWIYNMSLKTNKFTISVVKINSVCINEFSGDCLNSYGTREIMPSVYLKSNVYYISGTGSSTDPFIIK